MNDAFAEKLARAFDQYAATLDELAPSARLNARIRAAIDSELGKATHAPRWLRHTWTLAAGALLAISIVAGLIARSAWLDRAADKQAQANVPPAATQAALILPSGGASLWPTEATVFRVRSSLGAPNAAQQYWLDVRMANDGSMRIERVLTADGAVLYARAGIEPGPAVDP